MTLKFDVWHWKTIGQLFYATSSSVYHFVAIGEFKLELQSGNAQSGSNSTIFLAMWPWNLTDDLEKQQGPSPKQHQALCIISLPYVNSNWSYGPETAKWGHDLCDLDLWPLTLTFCIMSVNGNNSWKFQDGTMMGTEWKMCDRRSDERTDRQTDRSVLRAAWSQLKISILNIVKSGTYVNQHGKNSKCAKCQISNLKIDAVIAKNAEITN